MNDVYNFYILASYAIAAACFFVFFLGSYFFYRKSIKWLK